MLNPCHVLRDSARSRVTAAAAVLLLATALVACDVAAGSEPAAPPAASPVATGSPAPGDAAYQPLEAEQCDPLRTAIEGRLAGADLVRSEQIFDHALSGTGGVACWLWINGTGESLGSFVDAAQAAREVLLANGWEEDMNLVADGPTGLETGFRKDGAIALIAAQLFPPAGLECSDDAPISECLEDVDPADIAIEASVLFAEPAE